MEEAKVATQAAKMAAAEAQAATNATKPIPSKKVKEESNVDVVSKDEIKLPDSVNPEETQDEDDCSAKPCLKPLGINNIFKAFVHILCEQKTLRW